DVAKNRPLELKQQKLNRIEIVKLNADVRQLLHFLQELHVARKAGQIARARAKEIELRSLVRNDRHLDPCDLWGPAPILLIRFEDEAIAARPLDQTIGAKTHIVLIEGRMFEHRRIGNL